MFRLTLLVAFLATVAAFMSAPSRTISSNLHMRQYIATGGKSAPPAPAASAPAPASAAAKSKKIVAVPKSAPAPAAAAPAASRSRKLLAAPKSDPVPPRKLVAIPKSAPAPKPTPAPRSTPSSSSGAKASIRRSAPKPAFQASASFAGGLVGADVEAGEFDPFGLSVGRSAETLAWFRAAELKHARVCMLAALGLLVQPAVHLPDEVFSATYGLGAVGKLYAERPEAIWQIITALSAIEVVTLFKDGQGEAGDFNWDPLNFKARYGLDDPAALDAMKLRELKNGRLAILGASGILLQEYVSGINVYGTN